MKRVLTILVIASLLLIILPYFSSNANADGGATIEVKVTRFGIFPITNAEVTGEDMVTYEVTKGVFYAKTGKYYINIWFDSVDRYKNIHVKVVTNVLGIQEDDVYDLHESDVVPLEFNFGLVSHSRIPSFENHWGFPVLSRIFRFLFTNILV